MNNKVRIFIKEYWWLLITFVTTGIWHIWINQSGDDLVNGQMLFYYNLPEYIKFTYTEYSSRLLINSMLIYLCRWDIRLWKLLDTIVLTATGAVAAELIKPGDLGTRKNAVMAMLLCPYESMRTAGYIVGSTCYTWPLLFLLVCFTQLRKAAEDKPLKVKDWIIWAVALIFTNNAEAMHGALLGACILVVAYRLFHKKKVSPAIWIMLGTAVAGMVFILTCPGNHARGVVEAAERFPEYSQLNILQKLDLGFSSTMFHYIMQPNAIFALYAGILACAGSAYGRRLQEKVLAWLPFGTVMCFSILSEPLYKLFPNLAYLGLTLTRTGTLAPGAYTGIVVYIIYIAVIVGILYDLYLLYFGAPKVSLMLTCGVLVGFASRLVMGFTATIWDSGDRTFYALDMILIFSAVALLNVLFEEKKRIWATMLMMLAGVFTYLCELIEIWIIFGV